MERKVVEEIKLSNGKKAVIYEGTGEDFIQAVEIASATEDNSVKGIILNLMESLIEIDGQKIPAEELARLPLKDFMKLYTKVAENLS